MVGTASAVWQRLCYNSQQPQWLFICKAIQGKTVTLEMHPVRVDYWRYQWKLPLRCQTQ